jgi:hypothetical protein
MSLDTRDCKEGDELAIWITGVIGDFRAKVVGHSERHGGTAILQVLNNETGEPIPSWINHKLKGEDYIARSTWEGRPLQNPLPGVE